MKTVSLLKGTGIESGKLQGKPGIFYCSKTIGTYRISGVNLDGTIIIKAEHQKYRNLNSKLNYKNLQIQWYLKEKKNDGERKTLYRRIATNKCILVTDAGLDNQWLLKPPLQRVRRTRHSHNLHISRHGLLITKKKVSFWKKKWRNLVDTSFLPN